MLRKERREDRAGENCRVDSFMGSKRERPAVTKQSHKHTAAVLLLQCYLGHKRVSQWQNTSSRLQPHFEDCDTHTGKQVQNLKAVIIHRRDQINQHLDITQGRTGNISEQKSECWSALFDFPTLFLSQLQAHWFLLKT